MSGSPPIRTWPPRASLPTSSSRTGCRASGSSTTRSESSSIALSTISRTATSPTPRLAWALSNDSGGVVERHVIEVRVQTAQGEQLFVRALFGDDAVVENENAVGVAD